MGYLTSGNVIVDAMGTINISGNIIPAMKGTNNSCADVSDNKKGGSLPTKSDSPMEIFGGRGIPKGKQVSTNLEAGYDEMDNTIPTKRDTGLSKNGDRYPYTSEYISDGESYQSI